MPETTAHPSREQLSAYNLGQLPADEAIAVESHVSECEPCCDTIIALSSDDTFIATLREAKQLPIDPTVEQNSHLANLTPTDVPAPLAEHPRYEVIELIGKGGMGDVYKARHRKMERTVALKVINRGLVQKTEAVDRFHREVKAAAQLSHPNIVTAHDADQAGDFHFMVMECVDGVDLSRLVKARGGLPVAEACDYIRQAATGLQHAHERGMVHRDIKPHNLMVTTDGTVKILDFGLASLAPEAMSDVGGLEVRGDLTAAGAIMGTPDFISPEQADNAHQADIRSDIYSLGATLYYLLSGRPPFADGSVMHKLKSHAQAEPEPLNALRDDVPPELVAVVTKMTAKNPEERYLTPAEVATALESFLRTWRPNEAVSPGKEPSGGGYGVGSDRQKPGAGDAIPEWLPVAAKWLTYLSWIPITLLVWEVLFTDFTSDAADIRFWFYIGAAFCLSTIAGALSAAQRFQSEIRQFEQGDRRIFRMKAGETLLIAGILIFSVSAIVHHFQTNHGIVRVEVNDPSLQVSINNETITMKDGDGKELTIRPGQQTLIVRKDDANFEFETDRFQIRRGDEIAFKVEMLQGEIVVRKDGERFNSKALPDDVKVQQILDWMGKAYAECDSYRDSGVIKTVTLENTASPQITVAHSFTTVFQRPDRFRFEIKDEDDDRLLIFANGQNVRTRWDVEPGIQKPESLELALAQATGFSGGHVGRIPAMLMPKKLEGWGGLDLIDPKQIEDGKLQNVDCFRLEYNFRDEQIILWIDKQSYLVRRIDERIKADGLRIERTTTFDPTIDGRIPHEMLEFDPRSDGDQTASSQIRTLQQALDFYRIDNLTYPSTKDGLKALIEKPDNESAAKNWNGPYIKELPTDPWGNAFQYAFLGGKIGEEIKPDIWSRGPDGKDETEDDIRHWEQGDDKPLKQMSKILDEWKGLPEDSTKTEEFAQKINSLHDEVKKAHKPNTEASRHLSARLAVLAWSYLKESIPKPMAQKLAELTKPDAAVRVSDRLAAAGRPTEPVGWDVQATHALALARAGKIEEALKENELLTNKINMNLRNGRLPNLQLAFLEKTRSQKSLLQQSLLQKAIILAIAGKTAESVDAATAAGRVEVDKPTKEDQPAIQAMLGILAKAAETSVDASQTPAQSKVSAEQKTTEFLEEAAKRGDLEAVEAALKAGVAPNHPSNPLTNLFRAKQLTALHWAVAERIAEGKTIEPSPRIAERLIEAGADVNAADYLGQTPLEWAATHGTPEIVKMLIKAGANVNAESRYGTVLEATKNVEIAKLLIEAGANVNAGTTMTPLAQAAKSNNVEMIQLLIEKGAKVKDPKNPPIHWAGKPEVAKALIQAGSDVNQRNGKGQMVLHWPSVHFGPDAETVKLLIEAGADVNAKSQTDVTPLHAAIEQNNAEMAQLLIAAGAKLDAKDKEGNTPLSLAHRGIAWARRNPSVESKPYETLKKLLVDAGAKDDGRTPLQQAVAAGDLDQVQKLIAAPVDVNETGPQKITALHLASEKGKKDILAALIEAGAKPDQADAEGLRPLHLAANAEIARLLIAANAKINSGMRSPLYLAAITGKADVVRELVKNKANVRDSDCASILNWAVFAGQIEVIKVLFEERDAKTLLQAETVYSPLHVVASGTLGDIGSPQNVTPQRRLEIAKVLIEKGANVNARWGTQVNRLSGAAHMIDTTPLMFASINGEAEMIKFLLEKGGKVNATNAVGQTALHFAAQSGHDQVVELLLKAKADVNALTKEAKTPLDLTQKAAVKILLLKNGGRTASELLKDSQR